MGATLKFLLMGIALVAVLSGINVLIGGAAAVPGALGPVSASVDNELRFFAVMWLAFGGFCFWVARRLDTQYFFVPYISGVFFVGGLGRLLSILSMGHPGIILLAAMILELLLPAVMYVLYRKQFESGQSSTAATKRHLRSMT